MFQALQIFEPRYLQMINECLLEEKPFGIILIDGNFPDAKQDIDGNIIMDSTPPLRQVGTLARITDVTRLEDGRLLISTVGTDRFKLLEYHENKPYVTGDIEIWPEGAILADQSDISQLVGNVTNVFQNYLEVLMAIAHKRIEGLDIPEDPTVLSYVIPHWLPQITLEDKQLLLELQDPLQRLHAELKMLIRETEFLHKIMAHAEENEQDSNSAAPKNYPETLRERFSQN
jgi:Lon protease-like protein